MRMYFAILAASLFAATSLASPVLAQSVPKPADQAQPSARSDDNFDADDAGADDSGAQLDSFKPYPNKRERDTRNACRNICIQNDYRHHHPGSDASLHQRSLCLKACGMDYE